MFANILFYFSGICLLFLASLFAVQRAEQAVHTAKTFSDFSGDVQSWLRSVSE